MWMILVIFLSLFLGIAIAIFAIILLDKVPSFRPETITERYFGTLPSTYNSSTVNAVQLLLKSSSIEDLRIRMKHSVSRIAKSQDFQTFDKILDVTNKFDLYNWKKEQTLYKDLPHFVTTIMGLDIHFIHLKKGKPIYWKKKFKCESKKTEKTIPLLLIHGFPSSVLEFTVLVPHLLKHCCNFNFSLDIVIPSIPGCGFSSAPAQEGFSHQHAALIFKILMDRLGYQEFYCHGADWNSHVPTIMAIQFPESIKGLHLTGAYSRSASAELKSFLCKKIPFICPHQDEINADISEEVNSDTSEQLNADTSEEMNSDKSEEVNADSSEELNADSFDELKADKLNFPEVYKSSDPEKEAVVLSSSPLPLTLWLLLSLIHI